MAYVLTYLPPVDRDFGRLPSAVLLRVDAAIRRLAHTPRPTGAKKLTDESGVWRLRVGDYRVLYRIDDANEQVVILRVRHRRDVYR